MKAGGSTEQGVSTQEKSARIKVPALQLGGLDQFSLNKGLRRDRSESMMERPHYSAMFMGQS